MSEEKLELSGHYGSFHKNGDLYDIRFERMLEHSIERVWDAITNPVKLRLWLAPNHEANTTEVDLRIGGKVKLQLMMAVIEGKITELVPGRMIEYTFDEGNSMRWELYEEGEEVCKLVFTERRLPPEYLIGAAPGWHGYLDILGMVLDEKKLPHSIPENWEEISREATLQYKTMVEEINQKQL